MITQPEYELSVWTNEQGENRTKTVIEIDTSTDDWKEKTITKYIPSLKERKIAVIGKGNVTNPMYAFDINFKQNINGTSTLTFSTFSKYFSNDTKRLESNPFADLIKNETILKLKFQNEWYDLLVRNVQEDKINHTLKVTATDMYAEELLKNGYNIEFSIDAKNSVGNIYDLADKIVENTDWKVVRFNKNRGISSDIIRQYSKEPVYRIKTVSSNEFLSCISSIYYYDENNLTPLSLSQSDATNTQYIFVPYSQLYNSPYRFQFLLSNDENERATGTYTIDEEGYITNVKQCYIDLCDNAGQTVEENGNTILIPSFLRTYNDTVYTLTDSELLQVYCDRLVIPQQTEKNYTLGTTSKLYKYHVSDSIIQAIKKAKSSSYFGLTYKNGTVDGNDKIYHGIEEIQCNSFDMVRNLYGFSYNWRNKKDMLDGWEATSWTDIGTYNPTLEVVTGEITPYNDEDLNLYKYFGVGAPWQRVNLMWLRNNNYDNEGKVSIYSNSIYNEENVPDGLIPGEEYTFRVCFGTYYSGIEATGINEEWKKNFNHRTVFSPLEAHGQYLNGEFIQGEVNEETLKIKPFSGVNCPLPFQYVVRLRTLKEDGTDGDYLISSTISNMSGHRGSLNHGEYATSEVSSTKQKQYQVVEMGEDTNFCWVTQQLHVIAPRSYSAQELRQLARERRLKLTVEILYNHHKAGINKNIDVVSNSACRENGNLCYVDSIEGYIPEGSSSSPRKTFLGILISAIQLFKTYRDANGKIIYPDALQDSLNIRPETWYNYYSTEDTPNTEQNPISAIKWFYKNNIPYNYSIMQPLYDPYALRIKNFENSKSNRFNLLQKLSEEFDCWVKFTILHNEDGSLKLNSQGIPYKYVTFHNTIGENKQLGFTYNRNLTNIIRTLDSTQIATKLIVPINSNSYGKDGFCAVGRSTLCPTREDYLYNLSYFSQSGMVNETQLFKDLYIANRNSIGYYPILSKNNAIIQQYSDEINTIKLLILKLDAIRIKNKQFYLESYAGAEELIKKYKAGINALYSSGYDCVNFKMSPSDAPVSKGSAIIGNSLNYSEFTGEGKAAYNVYKYRALNLIGMASTDTINEIRANVNSQYGGTALPAETYTQIKNRYREYARCITKIKNSSFWKSWDNNTSLTPYFRVQADTSKNPPITSGWKAVLNAAKDSVERYGNFGLFYKATLSSYTHTGNEIYSKTPMDFSFSKKIISDVFDKLMHYLNEYILNYESYVNINNQIKRLEDIISRNNSRVTLLKKQKSNIELLFISKYQPYIREGVWSSEQYVNDDLYYLNAVNVLNNSCKPKLTYSINVIDLSPLEKYRVYQFKVGDRAYIQDEEFFGGRYVDGVYTLNREQIVFDEINYNLTDPSKNTYSVKNYKSNYDTFLQQMTAQVQSMQFSKGSYDRAAKAISNTGITSKVLNNSLKDNTVTISNMLSNSVKMGNDGLIATNPKNPCQRIELNNNGFNFSIDGGRTWMSVYDILSENRLTDI